MMDRNIGRVDSRTRHAHAYTAPSRQAIEDQAMLLLHALITCTHPRAVLEVGVYMADTTVALRRIQASLAAIDAPFYLDAVEIERDRVDAAWSKVRTHGRGLWDDPAQGVTIHHANFLQWQSPRLYDIALIDADWNNRDAEYRHATPMMHPGGLILTHDTGDASPGRSQTLAAARDLGHQHIDLALPRGLIITQVPW